jgi:hypothetical protein
VSGDSRWSGKRRGRECIGTLVMGKGGREGHPVHRYQGVVGIEGRLCWPGNGRADFGDRGQGRRVPTLRLKGCVGGQRGLDYKPPIALAGSAEGCG